MIVAIPLLVLMFLGVNRHYRRFARRLRASQRGQRRRHADERGARLGRRDRRRHRGGAVVRPPDRSGRAIFARCTCRAATPTPASTPLVGPGGDEPQARASPTGEGCTDRLLEQVWRLPRGDDAFVTVVVPEQFRRASLLSRDRPDSFRVKLRAALRARRRRRRRAHGLVRACPEGGHPSGSPCASSLAGVHGGVVARAQLRALA